MDPLRNYFELRRRVDELCRRVEDAFREHIACRRGCDACCRHLSLFQVEGAALARALRDLPPDEARRIRERARGATPSGPCPLLENGVCLLYAERPLICRTHGLPILTEGEGGKGVDFCPENFRALSSLPASAVLDLERLNTALAAIERLFLSETGRSSSPGERLTISEILLRDETRKEDDK